ncbi:MAG: hypothetical protein J1E38_07715, partial [Paramuribaculum sp.]|nr:hypothetical protein [Paramuribaculum sp.]
MVEHQNKSLEEIALEEKDRRTNLKKFCDSILQKIRTLDNNSGYRAIWELCQNARDLSENAIIQITLENNLFTFAHKGEPFNEDSLLSLVKQVSAEGKENNDTAGQFGTGFITTHKFNRKFYLSGSFKTSTNKIFDINNFEIDRSEDEINSFIDKMDMQIKAIYQLLKNPECPLRKWTEFKYPLNEQTVGIANRSMEMAKEMLPYILVTNQRIREVTLINKIKNHMVKFCKSEAYEQNGLKVLPIKIIENNLNSVTFNIYYLEDQNNKIILPLSDNYTIYDINKISKLFVWFPLLGTENWGINFIYHSS